MAALRRGRKPAGESRAAEIREKLAEWKRMPESQRQSLRALAAEIGTSHQLLSFYLRQWDKWQSREYRRKSLEIRAHAKAESRLLTRGEEAQVAAYERAAMHSMIDSALRDCVGRMQTQAKLGRLSRAELKMVKYLARRGFPKAQEALQQYCQRVNNLPGAPTGTANSFRCE